MMRRHRNHLASNAAQQHGVNLSFRLERWHRLSMYAVIAVLFISGALWLVVHYLLAVEGEYGRVPHPLEHPAVIFHGACAMFGLFFVGSLLNLHMRRAHRAKRNRLSGWGMIAAMLGLTVTGFGLYYLSSDASHALWSWSHSVIGLGLPPLLVWHIVRGRSVRKLAVARGL
jgi:hypothetical protein